VLYVWEYPGEETNRVSTKISIISFIQLLLGTTKCLSIILDSLFDLCELMFNAVEENNEHSLRI
jgi:hypothetical protein